MIFHVSRFIISNGNKMEIITTFGRKIIGTVVNDNIIEFNHKLIKNIKYDRYGEIINIDSNFLNKTHIKSIIHIDLCKNKFRKKCEYTIPNSKIYPLELESWKLMDDIDVYITNDMNHYKYIGFLNDEMYLQNEIEKIIVHINDCNHIINKTAINRFFNFLHKQNNI